MIVDLDLGFSLRISTSGEIDRDFVLDLDLISDFCGFSFLRRGDLDLLDLELDLDGLLRDFCDFSLRSHDRDLESDLELDRDLFFFSRIFLLRPDDLWRDLDNLDLELFLFFLLEILFVLLRDLDLEFEFEFDLDLEFGFDLDLELEFDLDES